MPSNNNSEPGGLLAKLLSGVIYIYMFGGFIAVPYFNYEYARESGFTKWLFLGEIVPTLKAAIWPYYFVDSLSSKEPSKTTNISSKEGVGPVAKSISPPAAILENNGNQNPQIDQGTTVNTNKDNTLNGDLNDAQMLKNVSKTFDALDEALNEFWKINTALGENSNISKADGMKRLHLGLAVIRKNMKIIDPTSLSAIHKDLPVHYNNEFVVCVGMIEELSAHFDNNTQLPEPEQFFKRYNKFFFRWKKYLVENSPSFWGPPMLQK